MAGVKGQSGGHNKKPLEVHKRNGTYREDRHGSNAEMVLTDYLEVPQEIPEPNLKDPACKEQYYSLVKLLVRLNLITKTDFPEIEMMYDALQKYKEVSAKIAQVDILTAIDTYRKLSTLQLKYQDRFSKIGSRYCLSPVVRSRMAITALNIQKEVDLHNESIVQKWKRGKKP
ncbi:MAG: P27 family phage terminase small subunit [Treponema sp.]|jgi:phage terminase small subunit|nr:P27 family phage terminase small subunit [Treponema sp.]